MQNQIKIIYFFFLMLSLWACQEKGYNRPNIVFLLADDLGYNELGSYGQKIIKTPHLDALAEKSLRFTNFYAGNSVCSPSRAVLLTGRSATRVPIRGNAGYFGEDKWESISLDKDEFTLGEMFKSADYQSAFIGKWHLDNPDEPATWAFSHGFDFAAQEQWSARFGKRKFPGAGLWLNGDKKHFPYRYQEHDCKDAFYTDFAIDFLEQRDTEKPFFLFMSYRAPHSFEGAIRDTLGYAQENWPKAEQAQAAKITLQDQQVGRLIQQLKSMNVLENTIILYTSDNGAHFNNGKNGHDLEFFDSNGNLRGGKRDLYEGGLRVPLLVFWKDKIPEVATTSHIGGFQDLMPTFAEIIGQEKPSASNGISFLPLLLGKQQEKHPYLNWEIQLSGWFQTLPKGGFRQAVRMGKWKAVRYGIDENIELYDLSQDESETHDLANQHPDIVNQIKEIFKKERNDTPGFPYGGVKQNHKSQDKYKIQ